MRASRGGIGRNIRRRTRGREGSGDGLSRSEAKRRNEWAYGWLCMLGSFFSALNSLASVLCWVCPAVLVGARIEGSDSANEAPSVYGWGAGEFMGDP